MARQNDEEKDRVMQEFRDKKIDLLVTTFGDRGRPSTSPIATLMINRARRALSGLSQLSSAARPASAAVRLPENALYWPTRPTDDRAATVARPSAERRTASPLAEEDGAPFCAASAIFFGYPGSTASPTCASATLLAGPRDPGAGPRPMPSNWSLPTAALRAPDHAALRNAVVERYGKTLELAEVG